MKISNMAALASSQSQTRELMSDLVCLQVLDVPQHNHNTLSTSAYLKLILTRNHYTPGPGKINHDQAG